MASSRHSVLLVWLSLSMFVWVSAIGCASTHESSGVSFRQGGRPVGSPALEAQVLAANGPEDHYLLLKPKRDSKPGKETVAFVVVPYHLWAPFRIEIAAGVFQGKVGKLGIGQACLELDERDSSPLVFYNICLRDNGTGGLNVFSFNGGSGQANFPGSEVEFAFEADGANLVFEVRQRYGAEWTEIHSIPFADQTEPLVPSVGSFRTDKGAKVGFDEIRIVANGDDPEPLTPEREVVETIWAATISLLNAAYLLDGLGPNFVDSPDEIADARAGISAAKLAAEALEDGKPRKKALKWLKKAKKEAKEAAGFVDDEKAKKSYDRIVTTMNYLISAVMALEPDFDLPSAP